MKRIFARLAIASLATSAHAHFPWLVVEQEGNASYFFAENIADRTYKLPPGVEGQAAGRRHRASVL